MAYMTTAECETRRKACGGSTAWGTRTMVVLVLSAASAIAGAYAIGLVTQTGLGAHIETQKNTATAEAGRTARQRTEDLAWRARIEQKLDEALKRPARP